MAITKNWTTRQIDFVMAYTQADAETDNLYMKIPKGFDLGGAKSSDWVLKLRKNLYGQKQAGRVWNKHLVAKLKTIGFQQSQVDECVFYKDSLIYVLYTDDSILTGPREKDIDDAIEQMKNVGLDIMLKVTFLTFLVSKLTANLMALCI